MFDGTLQRSGSLCACEVEDCGEGRGQPCPVVGVDRLPVLGEASQQLGELVVYNRDRAGLKLTARFVCAFGAGGIVAWQPEGEGDGDGAADFVGARHARVVPEQEVANSVPWQSRFGGCAGDGPVGEGSGNGGLEVCNGLVHWENMSRGASRSQRAWVFEAGEQSGGLRYRRKYATLNRMNHTIENRQPALASPDTGSQTVRTVIAAIRPRNAREHRALERLWGAANKVRNALVEFERSIRWYNRRVMLRHGTDWRAERFVDAEDGPPRDRDTLVKYARSYDLGRIWREVRHGAPGQEGRGSERLMPERLGSLIVNGIFDDYCRRYTSKWRSAPRFRRVEELRSIWIKKARVTWRGGRDGIIRITGLPRLRFRLRQGIPARVEVRRTVRLVRRERGVKGVGPGRYELHFYLRGPAKRRRKRPEAPLVVSGWDPGGRWLSGACPSRPGSTRKGGS